MLIYTAVALAVKGSSDTHKRDCAKLLCIESGRKMSLLILGGH